MPSLFTRKHESIPSPSSPPAADADIDRDGTVVDAVTPSVSGVALRPLLIDQAPPAGARFAGEPVFRVEHPLCDRDGRLEWIVERLILSGSPFADTVHVPASLVGGMPGTRTPKTAGGSKRITYAAFRGVIARMLAESADVEERCLPAELVTQATFDSAHTHARDKVERGCELLATLFLHYWRGVAFAYPDAWAGQREHVLWLPAGLAAFASLGSMVIRDHMDAYNLRQHYFDETLTRIAALVPVTREALGDTPPHAITEVLTARFLAARTTVVAARGRTAIPGTIGGIDWGSGSAPRSPDVDGSGPGEG
ncbi:hypothetical protein EV141_0315 [Microcella putealis]|uniref:Uncharacterized protein n=1 Tax=Microcella putealis TaxID=337005 RepID=A0A4Q7LXY9_9MICO|nr:hypothetical protein [Microcella putealis]RZS59098.1 hypothetical protein EV141_0315 [Microcella putealis]TQM24124.1 hypothetical protein BJ957_1594 [Microcella putealis]